ncbi:MAG: 4Fe-4S dicluster domain-containing protein [Candidatus Omnitrophica bacterium]|nr:4Fe-4S dicluster domain-containing protein [Candidatus Omnitrophota bacterium]
MQTPLKFISTGNLRRLLEALGKDYQVYVPVKKGNQRFYKRYLEPCDDMAIAQVRPFEPLKAFFFSAREKVARGFEPEAPLRDNKPYCIVGVKACDLKGFKVQDYVFDDHDYQDPFYISKRKANLIISSDCSLALETCFCSALGLKPYPQADFDLNLSEVKKGFLVETGSHKGEGIIKENSSLFEEAEKELIAKRDENREQVAKEVEKNIKYNDIPDQKSFKDIIQKNYDSSIWKEEAKACVECGACNTVCPTCHCFLLYDQKDEDKMARLRIWDSCMIKDFARVAGGANPRHKLWMRLRNRFEKKFDFFPKVADIYACTGCGRCISACPAKIDIRRVLKALVANVK